MFNVPAWTSGITVRAGGPIRTDDNNAATVIAGFYTEPGQGPSQLAWPTLVLGGQHGAGVKGVSRLRHDEYGIRVDGKLGVGAPGAAPVVQFDSGSGIDCMLGRHFRLSDNPLTAFWAINCAAGNLNIASDQSGQMSFIISSALQGSVTTSGFSVPAGKTYSYDGAALFSGGVLAAGAFPALTGEVTTSAGALATTVVSAASATGALTTSGGGVGYRAGAGGTITQATSKSTGVTLNKLCGRVTMNAASLAANTAVSFTLSNSTIATGDLLILNHVSGGTAGAYALNGQCAAGSASISVRNFTAGALAEPIVIGFAVHKAATS
jgi:hypothetical protein